VYLDKDHPKSKWLFLIPWSTPSRVLIHNFLSNHTNSQIDNTGNYVPTSLMIGIVGFNVPIDTFTSLMNQKFKSNNVSLLHYTCMLTLHSKGELKCNWCMQKKLQIFIQRCNQMIIMSKLNNFPIKILAELTNIYIN